MWEAIPSIAQTPLDYAKPGQERAAKVLDANMRKNLAARQTREAQTAVSRIVSVKLEQLWDQCSERSLAAPAVELPVAHSVAPVAQLLLVVLLSAVERERCSGRQRAASWEIELGRQ